MAATTNTLLDRTTVSSGDRISAAEAPDMGDSSTLVIAVTVHTAAEGESPTLLLMHAAEQDDDAWLQFDPPIRISLARTGRFWFHIPAFTRYVGWLSDGNLDTGAVVSVKLIGKA